MTLDLGPRSQAAAAPVLAAARSVPEMLRERIEQPEWQEWWLSAFRARLQRGERDAVRLYPELLRMVGAEDRRLELALGALGVSLEIAKRAVGMYQAVEGMDMAAMLETARSVIERAGGTVLMPAQAIEPGGGAGVLSAGAAPEDGAGVPPATSLPGSTVNGHGTNGGKDAQGSEGPRA